MAFQGATVAISPLLRLKLEPDPTAQPAKDSAQGKPGSSGDAVKAGAAAPTTFVQQQQQQQLQQQQQPDALERSYWDWRLSNDLLQVDVAFLALSASQALLVGARLGGGSGSSGAATALVLAACAAQLCCLALGPRRYAALRVPLLCAVRAVHSAAGWLSLRGLDVQLLRGGALAAAGAPGELRAAALQAVLAVTSVGRLALQPLGQQLPFRVALPLQLVDFGLARAGGRAAVKGVSHFLELEGHQLGGGLHLLHDTLDGLLHGGFDRGFEAGVMSNCPPICEHRSHPTAPTAPNQPTASNRSLHRAPPPRRVRPHRLVPPRGCRTACRLWPAALRLPAAALLRLRGGAGRQGDCFWGVCVCCWLCCGGGWWVPC